MYSLTLLLNDLTSKSWIKELVHLVLLHIYNLSYHLSDKIQYQRSTGSWLSVISSVSLDAFFPSEPSVPLQKDRNSHNNVTVLSSLNSLDWRSLDLCVLVVALAQFPDDLFPRIISLTFHFCLI